MSSRWASSSVAIELHEVVPAVQSPEQVGAELSDALSRPARPLLVEVLGQQVASAAVGRGLQERLVSGAESLVRGGLEQGHVDRDGLVGKQGDRLARAGRWCRPRRLCGRSRRPCAAGARPRRRPGRATARRSPARGAAVVPGLSARSLTSAAAWRRLQALAGTAAPSRRTSNVPSSVISIVTADPRSSR